eukprot:2836629-Prymnesium_polylepis.2
MAADAFGASHLPKCDEAIDHYQVVALLRRTVDQTRVAVQAHAFDGHRGDSAVAPGYGLDDCVLRASHPQPHVRCDAAVGARIV